MLLLLLLVIMTASVITRNSIRIIFGIGHVGSGHGMNGMQIGNGMIVRSSCISRCRCDGYAATAVATTVATATSLSDCGNVMMGVIGIIHIGHETEIGCDDDLRLGLLIILLMMVRMKMGQMAKTSTANSGECGESSVSGVLLSFLAITSAVSIDVVSTSGIDAFLSILGCILIGITASSILSSILLMNR